MKPQERHVGLLFQNYALFPNMNVVQNLRTGLRKQKLNKEQEQKALHDIMENFTFRDWSTTDHHSCLADSSREWRWREFCWQSPEF